MIGGESGQSAAIEVKQFRVLVARKFDLKVTSAQLKCATWAKVSLRNWQQWESGERQRVNKASWELVHIYLDRELSNIGAKDE